MIVPLEHDNSMECDTLMEFSTNFLQWLDNLQNNAEPSSYFALLESGVGAETSASLCFFFEKPKHDSACLKTVMRGVPWRLSCEESPEDCRARSPLKTVVRGVPWRLSCEESPEDCRARSPLKTVVRGVASIDALRWLSLNASALWLSVFFCAVS